MKIVKWIEYESPIIECKNCKMLFTVTAIERDENHEFIEEHHQVSYNAFCFYCGKSLDIKDTIQ